MPSIATTLDPELAAALASMPRAANGSLMDLTDMSALRTYVRSMADQMPTTALTDPRVEINTVSLARGDGSDLDIVMFRPTAGDDARPALLWFHAGGQILNSAHDDVDYHAALALSLDCVLVAVDYRLAPETPAPGAAEDGYRAYAHVCAHTADLGILPGRFGLAGASGGGAIAAATALMARDFNAPTPCLLALSYAMLDDRNETPSSHQVTDVGVWDRRENLIAWAAVLGDRVGTPDVHPYAAPGRATDLSGLPPTFVAAAQYDVFRDEDIDFAKRLLQAGVPTELHVYAGAFHAWDRFAPSATLTREFEATWHSFLRRYLHG